jgi:23S rRNA pseudouridine955/2504/2580 synthase
LVSRVHAYLHQKGEWKPRDENAFTPALCNRIDRNTSGIVIAAKNAESLRIVNEKIMLQEIDKYYLAAVHGSPAPAAARLEGYIFKDAVKNRVYVTKDSRPGSKSAALEYRTIASEGRLSLLECRLITGRTHQIRAQLADVGHPLLGDGKYGSERLNKPYGETKQALCSYRLVFTFRTDAGILSYLDGKSFQLHDVPFMRKYFS